MQCTSCGCVKIMTMLPTTALLLLWVFSSMILYSCEAQGTRCEEGWFGSQCQYKCHCTDNNCDTQGSCTNNSTCTDGWFGPACQYVDLVRGPARQLHTPTWLHDGDDDTCNPDPELQSVSVILDTGFIHPHWIRIKVKDPTQLFHVTVQFKPRDELTYTDCRNMERTMVSCDTLDIRCHLGKSTSEFSSIESVLVSGAAVRTLCSVYISGGRNVAVRQKTSQSSTSTSIPSDSSTVVEGLDELFSTLGGYCSLTAPNDTNPTWNVTLSRPHLISGYIIDNRGDGIDQGLVTSFYTIDCSILFCTIPSTDRGRWHSSYSPTQSTRTVPITGVSIRATRTDRLSLCELSLLGDTVCRPGKYGRDCEHTCNCAVKDEACYVSTGGCPSGCAPGYQGESCDQPCLPGQCSVGCSVNCSQSCHIPHQQLNQPSSRIVSDICLDDCQDDNQELSCSFNDIHRGPTCSLSNSNRLNSSKTDIYLGVGIGLGVLVLIIIIVLSVYLYRRRQTAAVSKSGHDVQMSTDVSHNL